MDPSLARSAADRATVDVAVRGATPLVGLGAKPPVGIMGALGVFMLILDPESTCKWLCNKKSNSHPGCKNEQQAHFEV